MNALIMIMAGLCGLMLSMILLILGINALQS